MEVAEAQRDYERQKTLVEKAFVTQSVADKPALVYIVRIRQSS